jgi:hypothetical protein
MSRRDPAFEAVLPAFLPNLTGSGVLIPGVADVCASVQSVSIASLGASGSATFYSDGQPVKTLAVGANGSAEGLLNIELPPSGALDVVTTTAMDVSALYTEVDHAPGITKEDARAATYQASLLSPKAIRTPNRFGGQVEG